MFCVDILFCNSHAAMVSKFAIHFGNVRGLRANFFAVYSHINVHRPDVLALCETQVREDTDPQDFHVPGYHILSLFVSHRGLVVYVKNGIVFQSQQHLDSENPEFNSLWIKFRIETHVLHFGFLYRSPNRVDRRRP